MPRGNGFDLLESVPERNFEVIFVTAYNQYAIKAFKYSAIDYILKPIDIDEFIKALEKAHQNCLKLHRINSNYDCLLENIKTPFPSKIALATLDNMEYISVSDIIRIEASGSYSKVFTKDNHSIMVSKSMKDFQDILEPEKFFRSHNSHIINMNHVRKFWFRDGGYLEMADKSNVPISRRKKEEFLSIMNKITGKG
jgi:two-component system LytT family response regulator